jgi:cell division protein FtsB
MARRRTQSEEVSVFNMSFLDVFCCTVGALIFMLVIQVLQTRDLVERELLEETNRKLAAAQDELQRTEARRDRTREELADLEEQLTASKEALAESRTELSTTKETVKEQDKTIEELLEKIRDPSRALPANLAGLGGEGRGTSAMEAQKSARGKFLLGNLETAAIVCTSDGLYLGMSRELLPLHDTDVARAAFRQFLRYHDPRQEGLWRTAWKNGATSYNSSLRLQALEQASIGEGLVVAKDAAFGQANRLLKKGVTLTLDLDGDGTKETEYEDTNDDGVPDVMRVNTDSDEFMEEVHLDHDTATGTWTRRLVDTDGDDKYDLLLQDAVPGDDDFEVKFLLPNLQTGTAVFRYEDTDNDGTWDIKLENVDLTNDVWEKTYTLFEQSSQRWTVILVDADADGRHDVMWRDTDTSNDDWEEKSVDLDGDGEWDVRWRDLDPRDNDWEAKFTERVGTTDVWKRCEIDSDADGAFDAMLVDADGDGKWDGEFVRDARTGEWRPK